MKPLPRALRRVAALIAVSCSLCTAATARADEPEADADVRAPREGAAAEADEKRRASERAAWRARVLDEAAREERDALRKRAIEDAAGDERACAEALAPRAANDLPTFDEPDEGDRAGKKKRKKKKNPSGWYGWQVLITDGASIAALAVAPPASVAGYALGGPIVHLAHGRLDNAAASLGTRVLLPPAFAFVAGALLDDRRGGDFGGLGMLAGGAVGVVSAMALDAALYARSAPTKAATPDEERPRSSAFTAGVAPRREGGVDVGVGMVF